ncbi:MAG: hypothetical protein FGF52_03705 [Candidatus Brockarchaeota archaeon]|nr:hypothetical protein [Candidatus Brockarchaeota archaeon]
MMEVKELSKVLAGALLAYMVLPLAGEGNTASFSNVNMIRGDLFILALSPPVDNIQVYVGTEKGGGYSYLVLTNRSLGIPDFPGRVTLIQLIPEDPLTNMTAIFSSNTNVKILYGVLTTNYTYYKQVSSKYYAFSNGIFVVLPPLVEMPAGESKITFIINTFNLQKESGGFRIELPPLATAIPVIVTIAFLVYLSAYAIVDSYYISAREELSKARKLGIALLLILNALAIYWLIGFVIKL